MGSFSAEVLYPAIAPMVNHFFNHGSCLQALFHAGQKRAIFVQGQEYHIKSGQRNIAYDPFVSCASPDGDVYDSDNFLIIKKDDFEKAFPFLEVGVVYEPRLAMLIAGVIESSLQGEQKWCTDKSIHRHLINVIDDQCLANLSGVGPEYAITVAELNAEFVARCNETVTTAMRAGNPVTYRMAESFNRGWYTQEHDHILRNYIFTKEVDKYLEDLNLQLFLKISSALNLVMALYDNESKSANGWRVFTATANKGVVSIFNEGDFRALDWQFLQSEDSN